MAGRAAVIIAGDFRHRCAMPGLLGYMLAIVITLSGYLLGLSWLVRPPDPWLASTKTQPYTARQPARKHLQVAAAPAPTALENATGRTSNEEAPHPSARQYDVLGSKPRKLPLAAARDAMAFEPVNYR